MNLTANDILLMRRSRRWTQQDLAEKAGIERTQISRFEHGLNPSREQEQRIIKAFSEDQS